jgi:hypothetical protein
MRTLVTYIQHHPDVKLLISGINCNMFLYELWYDQVVGVKAVPILAVWPLASVFMPQWLLLDIHL